ncbi:MAG TPA: DUF5916 domain-containing protein [Usitatibacter sp.]|nr:DUF5916 domain-containing protein [Usitatibacter sp.]
MRKTLAVAALAAWGITLAGTARAIEALALAADEKIVVDGRVDEAAWARARPLDRFWEIFPQAEVEARVRTEARYAYDAHALYVAVRAWDPDPAQLRAPFARRDKVLSDQDMIVLFIDPVGNRKFAHFFRVNPRGAVGDGLYNEDSGAEDFSPDFEFEVATARFEGGWSVEFRIPFSVLRFTDPPSREWSTMVFRNYPRDQRYRISTSKLPRDQNCFICLNEPLTGLDRVAAARSLALTPDVTLRSVATREGGESRRESEFVPSLDLKWRPRADIVVDATINPDFSQVELDTPQLSGNAQFALFFPEKRPFFLEGADILEGPFRAIYTRSVTDPAWGVRATQRSGKFDGTVLVTKDDGGGLVLLPNTYGTGFARQDFKSLATFARGRWQAGGATVGFLATDRSIEDGRGYNRVAGPDFVWFPTVEHRLRAQVLGSSTTAQLVDGRIAKGEEASSHAVLLDWAYRGAEWDQYLNFEDVGRDFRADNGFFFQNGYRRIYSETTRKFVGAFGFNEVSPYLFAEYKTDPSGEVQYQQNNLGIRLGLPRATNIFAEVRMNNLVAVREGGGLRKRDQLYVGIESNPFPWFARLFAEIAFGDRVDVLNNRVGPGHFYSVQANLRPHERAEIEYRIDNDTIDSRDAVDGSERILRQRIQQVVAIWHLSARDSLRTIWQETSTRRAPSLWEFPVSARDNQENLSLVYGHRRGIGASFYLGASFSRLRDPDAGVRNYQTEVFAKGSWTFDVL